MHRRSQSVLSNVAAAVLLLLASSDSSGAEGPGYQPPNFHQLAAQSQASANLPMMRASPLAGGFAAAQGGAYMNAHGNPIVLPASYAQGCPPGGCPPSYAGGYEDPMAVDFGNYGQDQSGPHYFDISADVVFMKSEDQFQDVGAFTAIGVGLTAPRVLDVANGLDDYEPGWRIAARLDLGPLSVLEVTYMGLYDFGFRESVNSLDVTNPPTDFQLSSVFSNYGTTVGVFPIAGVDDGRTHSLDYDSDLQSTEFSLRRYWVGNSPRLTGTYLMGFRYLRLTEDMTFSSEALVNGATSTASRLWSSENDLVGFQLGADGSFCLRQGLRISGEAKNGIYNNRFKFRHAGDFPAVGGALPSFSDVTSGNQIAYAAEGNVMLVADILPSLSIRGGYQVLYMNSLATVGNNIDTTNISSNAVLTQSDALFHGFHGGIEYIW